MSNLTLLMKYYPFYLFINDTKSLGSLKTLFITLARFTFERSTPRINPLSILFLLLILHMAGITCM